MIAVDSSVLIDFLNRRDGAEARFFDRASRLGEAIVVGDIVMVEVLRGSRDDAVARRTEAWLRSFNNVPMLDPALAIDAAANYRRLRGLGITVRRTADLIIGTWCIAHAVPLLHRDRDFDAMAAHLGLDVVPA